VKDTRHPIRQGTLRVPDGPGLRGARWVVEPIVLAGGFLLYDAGRLLTRDRESAALAHAHTVHRLEAALHLPSEAAVQQALSPVPHLLELATRYYLVVHFPVMAVFLLFGLVARPREQYVWARNLLATMTLLALGLHIAYPLAPPRMFPQWGFVDTVTTLGSSRYEGATAAIANQFAAMPSLHVGWALVIAVVLWRTAPLLVGTVAWVHAAITVLVVIVTANHWWVDEAVAGALLMSALQLFPAPGRTRLRRRLPAAHRRRSEAAAR
jgi:hypothetical protein